MYQRGQLTEALDHFWELIRLNLNAAGVKCPKYLSQDAEAFYVWTHPGLVLSQTCGMPYRTRLHGNVHLVGTPDYGIKGCKPGYYQSALVVRENDTRMELGEFRDATFAYNQEISQSGYAAPFWHLKPHGFWFEKRLKSGAHLESAKAVAEGRADIASLDAVSWRLMEEYDPFARKLRVLEWTAPTPGLPLITALGNDPAIVRFAVSEAITTMNSDLRQKLGLRGIVWINEQEYLSIPNPN